MIDLRRMKHVFIILFLVTVLVGCSSSTNIQGEWDAVNSDGIVGVFDFNEDETFSCTIGIFQNGGIYAIEDDVIKLDYKGDEPMFYDVENIEKDAINLYSIDEEGNRDDRENIELSLK